MNFLICNVCLRRPLNGIKTYYVTSCFHLICERCTTPGDTECKKCLRKCVVIECDSRAPEKVRSLFTSKVTKRMALYKRILDFQNSKRLKLLSYYSDLTKKYKLVKEYLIMNEKNTNILWHKYQDSKAVLKEKDDVIGVLKRKLKAYEEQISKYHNAPMHHMSQENSNYIESMVGKGRISDYSRLATPRRVPLNTNSSVFISPDSIASKESSRSGDSIPYLDSYWGSKNIDPSVYATPKLYRMPSVPGRYMNE